MDIIKEIVLIKAKRSVHMKKLIKVIAVVVLMTISVIRVNAGTTLMTWNGSMIYDTYSVQTVSVNSLTGIIIHNNISAIQFPNHMYAQINLQKWNGSSYVTTNTYIQSSTGSAQWYSSLYPGTYRLQFRSYYYDGGYILYDTPNNMTISGYIETNGNTYNMPDALE